MSSTPPKASNATIFLRSRSACARPPTWFGRQGYQQPFIRELGEGTLQRERFAFYLLQDFVM